MSQPAITKFYTSRKRFKDVDKETKIFEKDKISNVIQKCEKNEVKTLKGKNRGVTTGVKPSVKKSKAVKNVVAKPSKKNELNFHKTPDETQNSDIPLTPKRALSSPDDLTPSKKKLLFTPETKEKTTGCNFLHSGSQKKPARRKLQMVVQKKDVETDRNIHNDKNIKDYKGGTPRKDAPEGKNLVSLINESRSKILFSGKLDELKKSLEKFSHLSSVTNEFQSNPFKITSVIKPGEASPTSVSQKEPAYKKYSYLTAPESSLVLPFKYKLLCETFRCMDTVVSMLNNRKEKITFEKVQSGVQKMNSRNFTKTHLAQIASVFPTAYSFHYEKCDNIISKNAPSFQLVITPNFEAEESSSTSAISVSSPKKSKCSVPMTPHHLLERKHIFANSLLNLTKKYHQEFLSKLNFPPVSDDKILRWHPKFQVDSVPDVQPATLPEAPEVKLCTAKDVLSKIRGKVRGRVEKALHSVAEENENTSFEGNKEGSVAKQPLTKKQSSALKGICTDLLEKIRARESAKLVEKMTRSPEATKREEMLLNVPKIVHILWHYFVAERKAAIPVDVAVEKIIHSCSSLTTPDVVKEHLQLIAETFPGWLSFIKITKGEYITMDKKRDINVMLDNIK